LDRRRRWGRLGSWVRCCAGDQQLGAATTTEEEEEKEEEVSVRVIRRR